MYGKDIVLKPITDKKGIESIKKILNKSSVNKNSIKQAKKQLKDVYNFTSK